GVETHWGSDPSDYSTDHFTSQAVQFIDQTPATHPVFLYLSFRAPHAPATPGPAYQKACPGVQAPRVPDYLEPDITDKPRYIQSSRTLWQSNANNAHRQDKLYQDGCRTLRSVDDAVGSVVDALTAAGRMSNTLLVYMSDNGMQFGEKWRWGKDV